MNDPITFRIEQTFSVADRGIFVGARLLSGNTDFILTDSATLAGYRIEPWVDIPRKLGANGLQELDFFVFKLRDTADRDKIQAGQLAELEP
jgi:hypothetical protein